MGNAANAIGAIVVMFLVFMVLLMLLSAAAAVFLGLSVYNDARYRCNGNAVMWGVLSGFFGIAAIVYLCVRSSEKFVTCLQCRQTYPSDFPACPTCGLPSPNLYRLGTPEQREKWKKRRILFLILFIVTIALAILAGIAVFIWYFNSLMQFAEAPRHYYYG